jgi:cell division protein FtsL
MRHEDLKLKYERSATVESMRRKELAVSQLQLAVHKSELVIAAALVQ